MNDHTQLTVDDLKMQGGYFSAKDKASKHADNESGIMEGHWSRLDLTEGLSMHYVDMEEVDEVSFTNQTTSGISFNLVYEGRVDFTLGDNRYSIESSPDAPVCGGFSLNQPEMRTRHTNKGMRVKKVNIFAEKKWLLDRSHDPDYQKMVDMAFSTHGQLFVWQPNAKVNYIMDDLIQVMQDDSFTQSMQTEAEVLKLLSVLLNEFFALIEKPHTSSTATTSKDSVFFNDCKALLKESLETKITLAEIAEKLNVSVSTLQRRFKASSGMTVAGYTRWLKLEKSKEKLIEGKKSIGEIAYDAGYDYVANYISAFKRQYSVSPAAYQKLHHRTP